MHLFFPLLIVGLMLQLACFPPKPEEYLAFRKLPEAEQRLMFMEFPIEKQIDYHMHSMAGHPPDAYLLPWIVEQNQQVVGPAALARLKSEQKDYRKADVMLIFAYLCRHKNCDQWLFDEVEEEIGKMNDSSWARMAKRSFENMKGEPLPEFIPYDGSPDYSNRLRERDEERERAREKEKERRK